MLSSLASTNVTNQLSPIEYPNFPKANIYYKSVTDTMSSCGVVIVFRIYMPNYSYRVGTYVPTR